MQVNHYEILEIQKSELDQCKNSEEILRILKAVDKKLMDKWHPKNAEKWTTEFDFCKKVLERRYIALTVLSDAEERKKYDSGLDTSPIAPSSTIDPKNDAEFKFREKWEKLKDDYAVFIRKGASPKANVQSSETAPKKNPSQFERTSIIFQKSLLQKIDERNLEIKELRKKNDLLGIEINELKLNNLKHQESSDKLSKENMFLKEQIEKLQKQNEKDFLAKVSQEFKSSNKNSMVPEKELNKSNVSKIIPKDLNEIHKIISFTSGELYGVQLVFEDYESAKAFRNEVTKIFNERDSHIALNFSGDKILSIVARMNSRFSFFEGKTLGIELLKELGEYVDFTKVPQKFYNASDNEIPNEKVPLEFR